MATVTWTDIDLVVFARTLMSTDEPLTPARWQHLFLQTLCDPTIDRVVVGKRRREIERPPRL